MINIQDIIPFMKKGWVAMDENGIWVWYATKPFMQKKECIWQVKKSVTNTSYDELPRNAFDIAPVDDWTKSLIKIDNTAREKFEEEYQNNIQRTIKELNRDD